MGKFWFGQRRLNKRLRAALGAQVEDGAAARDIRALTGASLARMKSRIRIGDILPLGTPVETGHGFLASALTRLETGTGNLDVYLVTVTFIRNREILTLTLYAPANTAGGLEDIMARGTQFLRSLEG